MFDNEKFSYYELMTNSATDQWEVHLNSIKNFKEFSSGQFLVHCDTPMASQYQFPFIAKFD